jgi:hypothetical protein
MAYATASRLAYGERLRDATGSRRLPDMPIPWTTILKHAPTIVGAAQTLLATQTRKVNERNQNIEARLEQLERASMESARLIRELAEQLQALTLAQADLQRRVRIAWIVSGVAAVAAAIAITLVFVR